MLKTIEKFIEENTLLSKGDRIVVGVSGGADSVCLFHVLCNLSQSYELTLFVVHVNHGIRGDDANEDEKFVMELCKQKGVSFTAIHADVPAIAKKEGLTEEEAGRKVRYEAFYKCYKENRCNKIAIAHNKNDNAETILFHLFRGSGIKGLTGIRASRDSIIRPLLCISRDEIENYLTCNGICYRTDKSNLTDDYSRNKIRHNIICFAQEEINPKAIEHIVSAASHLREINDYIEKNIDIAFNKMVNHSETGEYNIRLEVLETEDIVIQRGIIRKVFERLASKLKDVDALHINLVLDLIKKEVGKSLNLPYNILAVKGYHDITMKINSTESYNLIENQEITAPGNYYLSQIGKTMQVSVFNYKKSMNIPKNGCTKWFDYDKIKNTVTLRGRKEGDFIQIDSKGNHKKLKSLLIDNKIPREKRDLLPLIADGNHIMWIIEDRISEAYKISDETKVILEISIVGGKENGQKY